MAATLESLKELTTWEDYQAFMKERCRQLTEDPCAFYISKDKVDFDIDGKPWSGYAVLVGDKADSAVKKIQKEGVQFREGTCRLQGQDIRVEGVPVGAVKSGEVTINKLRLGYALVPSGGAGAGADTEALRKRHADLVAALEKNSVLADMDATLGPLLEQASQRASQAEKLLNGPDPTGAEALLDEGQELLGRAIAGVLEGGTQPDEAAELESRRQELVAELKDAAALQDPANQDALKQAAIRARDVEGALGKQDFTQAGKLLDEIEELLSEVVEGPEPGGDADPDLAGLADWNAYRDFVRAHIKRLPAEGGPFFVSRKKVEFSIQGKPFKGHAVLLGKKGRVTVQNLKKEGVLFKEGTCLREGKKMLVGGIPSTLIKGAAKTFLKLRVGRKIVPHGELPPEDLDEGVEETAAGAAAAPAAAPTKLSGPLEKLGKEIAESLVKLRDAADALKKAKLSDQPYRGDVTKLTNQLRTITTSADSDKDKEAQLKKLKTSVVEKLLDASVSVLDPKDPKTGPLIEKQIKARFGVDFTFREKKADGGTQAADAAKEGETLKSLYLTLAKAPVFPKEHLKTIETTLQPATAPGEGGVYYRDTLKAGIDCKRPKESMNYSTQLGSRAYFPEGVEDDCKPANPDPVKYFNWATLHEVAHAVDAQHKFMDTNGGQAKYGGWTQYGGDVAKIADVVSRKFGKGMTAGDMVGLDAYARALMTGGSPKAPNSPEEEAKRPAVKGWVDAVRASKNIWWHGDQCVSLAIDDVVYQESYGGRWTSYKLAARKQGIHGYQFRAPGEWFAELYAAYYSNKLKPAHPFVPELKKLEK